MKHKITNDNLPGSLFCLMEGAIPPAIFMSDGCSCSPDHIGGVDLRPACHFHDYAYLLGGNKKNRLQADDALFRNLMKCGLSRWKSNLYYRRVRLWGVQYFNWQDDAPSMWGRVVLFFSRYLSW